jgi:serine protease AprX
MASTRSAKCRERLHAALGSDAAEKATDAFCVAFGAGESPPEVMEAIVELVPEPWPLPPFDASVERMRALTSVQQAREFTRAAFGSAGNERLFRHADALLNPVDLLRGLYVRELRERFHARAAPIRTALERRVPRARFIHPDGPTRICWLNQTLCTWTDFRTLAAVAADPKVMHIDVPRALRPEIGRTGVVVGAVPYRAAHHHTGKDVIVAVIDYEVDQHHPAFQNRVERTENFTREDWNNPAPHGTAVAGIIAANGTLLGMAPDARIQNYKVFMTKRATGPKDFDGAVALEHALHNGAKIANCSWGTEAVTNGQSREARACDTAWKCGMTVVKSAGNDGPGKGGKGTMTCPADADGVIVVGATDREGTGVQPYSSRGPTQNGKTPHLVAPGGTDGSGGRGIDSCLASAFGDCGWGTSLAAPHVSGLLAVLLEMHPGLTPNEQRLRLLSLCTPFTGVSVNAQGSGLISIENLVPDPLPNP